MAKRLKKSSMKIKSSDDHEFVVEVEEINEMETLKTMVNFADEVEEEVPTCAIKGTSLEKVLVWTKYQNYFKNMDLKDIFDAIISADYLENKRMFKKMLKKVFLNNSAKDIDEAVNQYEDGTIVRLLDDFKRKNEVIVVLYSDTLKYFDPEHGQLITITKIPENVSSDPKICIIKGKMYVIGNDAQRTANVAEYDTCWRLLQRASFGPIKDAFDVDSLVGVGNKLYARCTTYSADNSNIENNLNPSDGSFLVLNTDVKNPRWKRIGSPPHETYEYIGCSCVAVGDDYICVRCDVTESWFATFVEKYEPKQKQWTTLTSLTSSRFRTGGAVLDGKIYVSGCKHEHWKIRT